jgi:DNA-binding transcriptional LysR family regulator
MIDSHFLQAFLACAQLGNFTRAAKSLHITQSALSQRIAKLESDLSTTLLIRDRTGVRLTLEGEELLRYGIAQKALESEVMQRLIGHGSKKSELAGAVRIGGFSSIMRSAVLPAISPLLCEHPNVRLNFISKELDELPSLLARGEIDYMISYREFIQEDINVRQIGTEVNYLVQKKGYVGPDIFLDHDQNDQSTVSYLQKIKVQKKMERRYLDDVYGLIDGVRLGLGRALIPIHLIKGQKDIEIVDRKNVLEFPLLLHFYRRPFYSVLHSKVIDLLEKNVHQHLGPSKKV